MSKKNTIFYRSKQSVSVSFSGSEISSDGSLILLDKIEKKHKLINSIAKFLQNLRNHKYIKYTREEQLKQRVFMLVLGYEATNDVEQLKYDPLFKDTLQNNLASQPTMSRFENSLDKQSIFDLCNAWIDRYVSTLNGRKKLVIDIYSTNDPTHEKQQLYLFNGYYGEFIYKELFFHDGETG